MTAARGHKVQNALRHSAARGAGDRPVLVVDDNHANREVALAMLARLGYEADAVDDGSQAVAAYRRGNYAIILMDCLMPNMDGYQATVAIRAAEQTGARVPIIAMTASAMGDAKEKCLAVGMDDYLVKPIVMDELHQTLIRWLGSEQAPMSMPEQCGQGFASDLFDAERVADIRGLRTSTNANRDAFTHYAKMFVDQAERQVTQLEESLVTGDTTRAAMEAHTLRGAAATIGVHRVAELCSVVEEQLTEGSRPNAALCKLIRYELGRARSALYGPEQHDPLDQDPSRVANEDNP